AIMGNFKGGVQIPFVQLSGAVAGQLSNSLQSDARGYLTFFWGLTQQNLPALPALSSHVANSLPPLVADRNTVSLGVSAAANQTILGWPSALCNTNVWTATAQNANFTAGSLELTSGPTTASSLSTCNIAIQFS